MSRSAGSTGLAAVRDFIPRHSRRLAPDTVAPLLGPRVSSLSDVQFYSSKSGVKDGAVSPIFPPLRFGKIGSPACEPRAAVLDPSLPRSGRSLSSTKEITQ
ncbi:hypothetical protein BN77_p30051 [Rhizobium mesoamericanum STM3625]|uniref:Uncharacterized protein n=1 Tax=Rhizobium mesoamericanum STM3625 TaxID=1211777 RepID=K0Q3V5_9HYPH|nr:hypothetical protein BN77_p30051 [Rhizobium mesoamericanum STM3625]